MMLHVPSQDCTIHTLCSSALGDKKGSGLQAPGSVQQPAARLKGRADGCSVLTWLSPSAHPCPAQAAKHHVQLGLLFPTSAEESILTNNNAPPKHCHGKTPVPHDLSCSPVLLNWWGKGGVLNICPAASTALLQKSRQMEREGCTRQWDENVVDKFCLKTDTFS